MHLSKEMIFLQQNLEIDT